jgi:hypothetical protein
MKKVELWSGGVMECPYFSTPLFRFTTSSRWHKTERFHDALAQNRQSVLEQGQFLGESVASDISAFPLVVFDNCQFALTAAVRAGLA